MSDPPSLREQIAGKCVHFTGVGNETCEAGVRYEDVRDEDRAPRSKYPCLRKRTRKGERNPPDTCPKRRWPTEEEVEQMTEEREAMFEEFMAKLTSDTCPHCDTDVKRHRQVEQCVYADPCGHRLYQGKAREVNGNAPVIQKKRRPL